MNCLANEGHRFCLVFLLFLTVTHFGTDRTFALPFVQRAPGNKLVASDAQSGDEFGYFLEASRNFVIVGAPNEDGGSGDPVENAGAAYVFDLRTGQEVFKLSASDAEDSDRFGWPVAISKKFALVGAHLEDGGPGDPRPNSGSAYVFDLETGEELFKLVSSDSQQDDWFGVSVAVSGNFAVVGSHGEDGGAGDPVDQSGAAYVFDLRTGLEVAKLQHSDPQEMDQFGWHVAIEGNYILVGARLEDGGDGNPLPDAGASYVFDLTTGEQLHKLTASDAQDGDQFGIRAAISGNRAIIAARYEDGGPGDPEDRAGAAYIFDLTTGQELRRISASDGQAVDQFGVSVDLEGKLAVVGALGEDASGGSGFDSGAVYAFDAHTGEELAIFKASDSGHGDRLGVGVTLSGDIAIAGAYFEDGGDGDPAPKTGAAYAFRIPVIQPDSRIGSDSLSGIGNDVYNDDSTGQTLTAVSRNLRTAKSWTTIENDGNTATDLLISGSNGNSLFSVSYFWQFSDQRVNVSASMFLGSHEEANLIPEEAGRLLCTKIKPSGRLKKTKRSRKGRKKTLITRRVFFSQIAARSTTLPTRGDTVSLRVLTR